MSCIALATNTHASVAPSQYATPGCGKWHTGPQAQPLDRLPLWSDPWTSVPLCHPHPPPQALCAARTNARCAEEMGTTKNEVYRKFICHDICCVVMAQCELGTEACFWGEDQQQEPDGDGMILKLRRGG